MIGSNAPGLRRGQLAVLDEGWRRTVATAACAVLLTPGCGTIQDGVFEVRLLRLSTTPLRLPESAGSESVVIRLESAVPSDVRANYEVRGIEAQDDCQKPDFEGAQGTLTFNAGSDRASVGLWIGQDELAEIDERIEIVLSEVSGGALLEPSSITVVIEDDDRDGIIDARDYGIEPDTGQDQTAALKSALADTAALGRGVLLVPPGDYEISHIDIPPGTTLSARGARFLRPRDSELGVHTIDVVHAGPANSEPTLIEGLSVDGRREEQGPYRDYERQDDHLILLRADNAEPGRLVVAVEDVHLSRGTADGIAVEADTDATLCHIQAEDIWREAISLHGGRSSLKVRGLDASASEGTSGIWVDGSRVGFENSQTVDVDIEDARLSTGDIELEVVAGSSIVLRRLSMTEPAFRVSARDSVVQVIDSVIQVGVPSLRHNNFTFAHDVRFIGSTIVSSERLDEQSESAEMDRTFSTLSVRWSTDDPALGPFSGVNRLSLDGCQLMLGDDIEPGDTLYGVENSQAGGAVVVRDSVLGEGFAGWFAPGCTDCQLLE